MTITDSAAGVTVDANDNGRHFGVVGDPDDLGDPVSTLTLNGLELTNGNILSTTRSGGPDPRLGWLALH